MNLVSFLHFDQGSRVRRSHFSRYGVNRDLGDYFRIADHLFRIRLLKLAVTTEHLDSVPPGNVASASRMDAGRSAIAQGINSSFWSRTQIGPLIA